MIENIKTKSQELDEMRERFSRLKEETRIDRERAKQETLIIEKQKNEIIKSAYEEAEKMMNEMSKASALVEKRYNTKKKIKKMLNKFKRNLNMLSTALREKKRIRQWKLLKNKN